MLLSEDLVFSTSANWIGIVDDSPFSSDEDESENEWEDANSDDDEPIPINPRSKEAPYRVGWLSNRAYPKTHHAEGDVQLLDRAMCKGDVVHYQNQLATVIDVNCTYDILNHSVWLDIDNSSDYILKNVPSSALYRDHEYLIGEHIFYNNFMGNVDDVDYDCLIKITNSNGSTCLCRTDAMNVSLMNKRFPLQFKSTLQTHNNPIKATFKHGYNKCAPSSFLDECITIGSFLEIDESIKSAPIVNPKGIPIDTKPSWFSSISYSNTSALVIALIPTTVHIEWICSNPFSDVPNPQLPPSSLLIASTNNLIPLIPLSLRKNYLPGSYVKNSDNLHFEVINVRSWCDLELQDGSILQGIPSIHINPTLLLNDEDYLPGDFIKNVHNNDDLGIVMSMNHQQRIANIKWYENGFNFGDLIPTIHEISLFDLKPNGPFFGLTMGCFIRNVPDSIIASVKLPWYAEINRINKQNGHLIFKFHNGIELELECGDCLPFMEEFIEQEEEDEEEGSDEWETDEEELADEGEQDGAAVPDPDPVPIQNLLPRSSSTIINSTELYVDNRDSEERVIVTEDPVPFDHFYSTTKPNNKILKRFNYEIALLKSHLPPGILVKSYEQRLDLMRIMIIGPKDTPYEDAMFYFDIHLHNAYPNEPPNVFYKSYSDGKQLNPNLFDNGKVCISLLNTTNGESFEMWNSSTSNLLQLCISIQSLILTKDPFWNEPIHMKIQDTVHGDQSKVLYYERTVIGSMSSILNVLRNGVEGFEMEVERHYYELGGLGRVIQRLKERIDGEIALGYKQSLIRVLTELEKMNK